MTASSDEILRIFREGDADALRAFVDSCPPSEMRDSAAFMITSDDPAMRVVGLGCLVQSYGYGQAPSVAAEIAHAGHVLGRDVLEAQGGSGALQLFTVSAMAATGATALNLEGRFVDALAFAEEVIPYYESLNERMNLPNLYVAKIEALLQLNRIDDAWGLLKEVEARGLGAPDLPRLRRRLEELMQSPTELASETAGSETVDTSSLRGIVDVIAGVLDRSGAEMNEWKAKKIIRDATSIFLDARGNDSASLRRSLRELEGVREWTRTQGNESDDNDALWGAYLCNKRLQRFSDAADALQQLRSNTEEQRAGISDPLQRGGITTRWPYLFPSLCEALAKADRVEELFDAMEGAKGRAVADLLTHRAGHSISERELQVSTDAFLAALRETGAHYVSFFVDDDWTLAVLVGNDGSMHQSGALPVGKVQIREAAQHVDPRLWGKTDPNDPLGPAVADISQLLSPLVEWLSPHLESGLLAEHDHVVYSPDEHLHHIPLHYVQLAGEPIIGHFSLSRAHGAHALTLILDGPAAPPAGYLSIEVPTQEDAGRSEVAASLHAAPAWLADHLPGIQLSREQTTSSSLAATSLQERVVHFATHGVFPQEGASERGENPFDNSGLVLAAAEGLPTSVDLAGGIGRERLLSPSRVLELGLDFSNSHVTLQACVSGLAKDGIGGDALGLDWALSQAGAASLLSSHWDVSARLSAEFFTRFYEHWLEQKKSRALAWRETVLELMDSPAPLGEPYAWAAFSLSGDWR